jgi:transposase
VSNVLNEQKKQQVIALGRLGWSLRRIQKATGIRRETAAAYMREAGVAVRSPGLWGRGPATPTVADAGPPRAKPANEVTTDFGAESDTTAGSGVPHPDAVGIPGAAPTDGATAVAADPVDAKPAIEVTTDFGGVPAEQAVVPPASASACALHRDAIELGLSRGRNAMAIWQDLVDARGFTGGYQSVKRFVRKLLGSPSKEACAVIETAPGEEAQVDYGTGPMARDPVNGKYRRMRLFVLTLGYCRKSIRLLVFQSSTQTWAELHEMAFRRLGGCTRVVVLDNLREGVLKPDIYDPTINPVYADMLRHYGVIAMPCRVADPDRKAYVSYCTLSGASSAESWLLGPPARAQRHLVQAALHQSLQLRPAGFDEMFADRALLQPIGFGKLTHRFAVFPCAQPEHQLLPHRFGQRFAAVKQFVAAQSNFLVVGGPHARPPDRSLLAHHHAVALLTAPPAGGPLRLPLATLPGQLPDFLLHQKLHHLQAGLTDQFTHTLSQPAHHLGHR